MAEKELKEAVTQSLQSQDPSVITHLKIVTREEKLVHISPTDYITEFVPRKPRRTADGENTTVERVSTSPSLLDAIRGYANTVIDTLDSKTHNGKRTKWKGGYYIYEIATEVNLDVDDVLAPISKWCDERWLISYGEGKTKYPAKVVGQFFYKELSGSRESEKKDINEGDFADVTIYINLSDLPGTEFKFSKSVTLGRGCYAITVRNLDAYLDDVNATGVRNKKSITLEEYYAAKEAKADLLSFTEPSWVGW